MNTLFYTFSAVGYFTFISCCLAQDPVQKLPADVPMNEYAGRGDSLVVVIRLEDGEELQFALDTGSPMTTLDSSLEPKLGKRMGTQKFAWIGEKGQSAPKYKAPRLYLGGTELQMDAPILTTDLSSKSLKPPGRQIKGILGMDCLRHYCIQLDFETGRIRFLDPNHPGSEDLGQAFHLSSAQGYRWVDESLIGVSGGSSMIDTGCNFDGVITPKLFRRWTNQRPASPRAGEAHFPNGVFGGSNYTNLYLHGDGGANMVGLGFLARNLVTLNFPKRTMYLKQRSARSLAEGNGFYDEFYPEELRKRLCKP